MNARAQAPPIPPEAPVTSTRFPERPVSTAWKATGVKVFVISDMEGISGIVRPHQTDASHAMYEEGRKLYTEDINAAVRGAKAGGATEIVVMDCHGAGEGYSWASLIAEDLDPDCDFVVQEEWTGYTGFLESGIDAALFVGMHAMAG